MIQELLGSGGSAPNTGVIGERNISISFPSPSPSPACAPPTTPIFTASSVASPATTKGVNSSNSSGGGNGANNSETTTQQNLRCPRCDSTNTKFCYYNNYNLTQPRHFCKTCRRYWTKGGTLRNVPIGGGCRKNKTTIGSGSSATSGISMPSKSSSNAMAKAKATLSTEMLLNASPGFLGPRLLDHLHPLPHPELQPGSDLTQALWPSVPQEQSSHILAVIRGATQFTNPNPNPSLSQVSSAFTHLKSESNTTLGLDPCGSGAPSIFGSFLRGNPHQINGFGLGAPNDVQNGGSNSSTILELYQRLKSSSNYSYCSNENPGSMVLGNVMGSSSSLPSPLAMNSSILENASGAVGENLGGYSMMSSPGISSWSDFPTVPINGALP